MKFWPCQIGLRVFWRGLSYFLEAQNNSIKLPDVNNHKASWFSSQMPNTAYLQSPMTNFKSFLEFKCTHIIGIILNGIRFGRIFFTIQRFFPRCEWSIVSYNSKGFFIYHELPIVSCQNLVNLAEVSKISRI